MKKHDDRLYLVHIRECIERVEGYVTGGKDFFFRDLKTQDAVMRSLQILAESAGRLSDTLKPAYPEVEWRDIQGFRNLLVHDYLGINLKRVWEIVERDLPSLSKVVDHMLANFPT